MSALAGNHLNSILTDRKTFPAGTRVVINGEQADAVFNFIYIAAHIGRLGGGMLMTDRVLGATPCTAGRYTGGSAMTLKSAPLLLLHIQSCAAGTRCRAGYSDERRGCDLYRQTTPFGGPGGPMARPLRPQPLSNGVARRKVLARVGRPANI
jgi:hypothetical protein